MCLQDFKEQASVANSLQVSLQALPVAAVTSRQLSLAASYTTYYLCSLANTLSHTLQVVESYKHEIWCLNEKVGSKKNGKRGFGFTGWCVLGQGNHWGTVLFNMWIQRAASSTACREEMWQLIFLFTVCFLITYSIISSFPCSLLPAHVHAFVCVCNFGSMCVVSM